ncbi:MAG: hypothetical protein LUD16_08030 [Lachnospiraceae bacterium]|nr:hypothetical protein [Lachnospiraceae bacterium]
MNNEENKNRLTEQSVEEDKAESAKIPEEALDEVAGGSDANKIRSKSSAQFSKYA